MEKMEKSMEKIAEFISSSLFHKILVDLPPAVVDNVTSNTMQYIIDTKDYDGAYFFALFASISGGKDYLDMLTSYLRNAKGLKDKEIYDMYVENHIKNGFYFHGTSGSNLDSIAQYGLLSREKLYGSEFIKMSKLVNEVYNNIYLRNLRNGQRIPNGKPASFVLNNIEDVKSVFFKPTTYMAMIHANSGMLWLREYFKYLLTNLNGDKLLTKAYANSFNDSQSLVDFLTLELNGSSLVTKDETDILVNYFRNSLSYHNLDGQPMTMGLVGIPNNYSNLAFPLSNDILRYNEMKEITKKDISFKLLKLDEFYAPENNLVLDGVSARDICSLEIDEDYNSHLVLKK